MKSSVGSLPCRIVPLSSLARPIFNSSSRGSLLPTRCYSMPPCRSDPTHAGSHARRIPRAPDPTRAGSHGRRIPRAPDPTGAGSHARRIPRAPDPTRARSHARQIPRRYIIPTLPSHPRSLPIACSTPRLHAALPTAFCMQHALLPDCMQHSPIACRPCLLWLCAHPKRNSPSWSPTLCWRPY